MSFEQITVTNKGAEILSKMMNGCKLLFTGVEVGAGTVPEEQLEEQTEIAEPISVPALIAEQKELESENGTQIHIQIRNDGLKETTRMKQIGLYAKTDHSEEVLFGITQDEIGEEITSHEKLKEYCAEFIAAVAIDKTNNIQVEISPMVYITIKMFNPWKEKVESQITTEQDTITLNNTLEYPFNDSIQTVSLKKERSNTLYSVFAEVIESDGNVGQIQVTDCLENGYKVAFTGSAKTVQIKCKVMGGYENESN